MDEETIIMKEQFYEGIKNRDCKSNSSTCVLTREKYIKLLLDVKKIKIKKMKPRDYWLAKNYDVILINGIETLICPQHENSNFKIYVMIEDKFHILHNVHKSTGHGGRDTMLFELKQTYKNITQADVQLYLKLCVPCQQKKKLLEIGIFVKPIIFDDFYSRCQIDLIDFQSQPDGDYKFICVYQDHLTKFCILRPLTSKSADQVAYVLLDIFCLFGAPAVLQSDNGREFCNEIINFLVAMWPNLRIIHGKSWNSQSPGSVERAHQDIVYILKSWMHDTNTSKWSEGLRFVQFMKNKIYHSGMKQSPYNAMFGTYPKTGISAQWPNGFLQKIMSEGDTNLTEESTMLSTKNKKRDQKERQQGELRKSVIQVNTKFLKVNEDSPVQNKVPEIDREKEDFRRSVIVCCCGT